MITDKAAFGLTVAERMAEENRESQRMYAVFLCAKAAVGSEEEAVEYTAEIMKAIGAERCVICGRFYLPADDSPLCDNCLSYEEQAWADHADEVRTAHAATNGTL